MQAQISELESKFIKNSVILRVFNNQKSDNPVYLNEKFEITRDVLQEAVYSKIVTLIVKIFEELYVQAKPTVTAPTFGRFTEEVRSYIAKTKAESPDADSEMAKLYLLNVLIPTIEDRFCVFSEYPKVLSSGMHTMSAKELALLEDPTLDYFNDSSLEASVAMRNLLFVQQKELLAFLEQVRVNVEITRLENELIANGATLFLSLERPQLHYAIPDKLEINTEAMSIVLRAVDLFRRKQVDTARAQRSLWEVLEYAKTAPKLNGILAHTVMMSRYMLLSSLVNEKCERFMECYSIAKRLCEKGSLHDGVSKTKALFFQKVMQSSVYTTSLLTRFRTIFSDHKSTSILTQFYLQKTALQQGVAEELVKYLGENEKELEQDYEALTNKIRTRFSHFRNRTELSKFYNKIHYTIITQDNSQNKKAIPGHVVRQWSEISLEEFRNSIKEAKAALSMPCVTLVDTIKSSWLEAQKPKVEVVEKVTESLQSLTITPVIAPQEVVKAPPFTFSYDQRVTRWYALDTPRSPFLTDPKYMGYFSEHAKRWIIAQHSFALTVDQIAKEEAIIAGEQHFLVGEMTIGNETKKGVFSFVFDKNRVCFHRYFTIKTENQLFNEYVKKGFYELDYPPLGEVAVMAEDNLHQDGSSVLTLTKQVVTIQDPKNKATIKLCRLR